MRRRRVGWAGEGFLLLCGRVRQLPRWGAGRAIALMLSPPLPPPPVRGPACARGARRTRRPVYFFFALFFFFPPRPPSPRHTADGVGAPPVADTPLPSSRHPPPSPIPRGEGGGRTRRSSPPPPPPLMPPLLPLLSGVPLGLPRAAAAPGLPHAAVASAERAPALSRPLPWPSGLSPDDGAAALNGGAARHGVFHAGLKAEPRPHWRSGRVSRGAHRQGGHPAGWGRPLPPHAASGGCQPAPPSPPRRGSTGQGRWRQGARAHPPRRDGFPARQAGRGCRDNTHHTGRVGGAGGAAPTALVSPPYPLESVRLRRAPHIERAPSCTDRIVDSRRSSPAPRVCDDYQLFPPGLVQYPDSYIILTQKVPTMGRECLRSRSVVLSSCACTALP